MKHRSNYYRLLNLAPSVQNWSAIETRINELIRTYNRVRTDAPKSIQREAEAFKILLDQPDDGIRVVMKDEKLRAAESRARLKELKAEEKQLDTFLRMIKSKGAYSKKDLKHIAGELSGFDEVEIESRIRKLGLTEEKPGTAKPKRKSPPMIPEAEGKSIEADQKGLQLSSLYDFLGPGLNPRSSLTAINAAYESQKNGVAKLVRGTPEHKVRSALLGHVQKHLLSESTREKYHNYLANRELRAVDTFIKVRGGASKIITQEALDEILREAKIPNVTVQQIRDYIEVWIERTSGWYLVVTSDVPAQRLLTCGQCGTLAAEEGQSHCRDCGKPLEIVCPMSGCKQLVPTQDSCCPKCGCSTGDLPHIERLIASARTFFRDRRYRKAGHLVDDILQLWPGYEVAKELLVQIESKISNHKLKNREVLELIRVSKMQAAQQLVNELAEDGYEVNTASRRQIDQGITAARKACDQARRLIVAKRVDDALEKYIEALAHCADYSAASDAMKKYPPSSPHDLRVNVTETHVRLTWRSKSSRLKTQYIVCRKQGGVPTDVDDGIRLATVKTEQYDDTNAEDGIVWYYAIFSAWGETTSMKAATSDAVLRTGKVFNLKATAIDGNAHLSWENPVGSTMAEVRILPEVQKVRHIRGTEAVFKDLQNGQEYEVAVSALYSDPLRPGKLICSPSEIVRVLSTSRPDPVKDLTAELRGRNVHLKWTPAKMGEVQIRVADRPPQDGWEGTIVDQSQVQSIGRLIPRCSKNSAEVELPPSGQMFLVPVTINGSNAAIGTWCQVAQLPEVIDFRTRPLSDGILELTWVWPRGIKTVGIFLQPVGSHKTVRQRKTTPVVEVSAEEFRANGNVWQVVCSQAHAYEITIAVKAPRCDFYSRGVSCTETMGNEARVRYQVYSRRFKLFKKSLHGIELQSEDGNCTSLDDVVVVGLPDRLPTRIDEGQVVCMAKRIQFSGGRAELPIELEELTTSLYLKVFLKNPQNHPCLKLLPASKERLLYKG